jgi:hypothetical protein
VKNVRRLARLGMLVMWGSFLGGCVFVPLHGWGHGHERGGYERGGYDRGGYERGGHGDRH